MASVGNYDEAISRMMAVPNVCADCYDKCQVAATSFYQQKIDAYGLQQLNKARNAWMKSQDAYGANEVAQYLNVISPYSSCYQDVENYAKMWFPALKQTNCVSGTSNRSNTRIVRLIKEVLLRHVVMLVWLGLTINLKV